MPEQRDAGVDPRFDPVFQRGYDPSRHRTRLAPRAAAPPRDVGFPTPDTESATPDLPPTPTRGAEIAAVEENEVPAGRNPFRLALLLTSLALVVAAAGLLWHRLTSSPYWYSIPSGDDGAQFRDSLETTAIPALAVGGLTGVIIWLALGVLRRRDGD